MRRQHQQLPKRQRGAVAVVVGLSIFVLVGMIGLALDSGQLFVNKTELQNAADACALAAASELDGSADGFVRGDAVGKLVGRENLVGFQKRAVAIENGDITYSDRLDSGFSNSPSLDAKFAKCAVERNDIGMWFMGVWGFDGQIVRAHAVATLAPSQTTCAVPVGLCSEGPAPTFGLEVGRWYSGKFDPGTKVTGSFNWIDFDIKTDGTPEPGGTRELRDLLAGAGQCELPPVGKCLKEQGEKTAVEDAWNTRFGIYRGMYDRDRDIRTSPPDFTGIAYTKEITWPNDPAENAYSGTAESGTTENYQSAKTSHSQYQDSDPVGIYPGKSYKSDEVADSALLAQYGTQRRVVLAPVLNCGELASGDCTDSTGTYANSVALRGYACVLMLRPINGPGQVVVEYLGQPNDVDSPCSSYGLAGGSESTGPLVPVLVQ